MKNFGLYSEDILSNIVIRSAIDVRTQLGLGLLEYVYKQVLHYKLRTKGLLVELKKTMPIQIDDIYKCLGYRIDLLIENKLVYQLKSVKEISIEHAIQTINYLKFGNFNLGLMPHFNVTQIKSGIRRVILTKGLRSF